MKISEIMKEANEIKFEKDGEVYYMFIYGDGSTMINRYTDNSFVRVRDFDLTTIDNGNLLIAEYDIHNRTILNYDLEKIEEFCKDKTPFLRRAIRGTIALESPLDYYFEGEKDGVKRYSCPCDDIYFYDISLVPQEEQDKLKSAYKYPFKNFVLKSVSSNNYSLD